MVMPKQIWHKTLLGHSNHLHYINWSDTLTAADSSRRQTLNAEIWFKKATPYTVTNDWITAKLKYK